LVYYVPEGPTGQIMARFGDQAEIGVIGLGVGSIASYVNSDQRLTFFEIDPAVLDLATNKNLFTFLSASEADLQFVLGDGRLMLTEVNRQFQLLIVDAFSSDAIPVHLLTLEAMSAYLESTSPDGVIAFHISNRHLDLEPVVGRLADDLDLGAVASSYFPEDSDGAPTQYVVVARDQSQLSELGDAWKPARIGTDLWTDEFSNLLGVLR
jgi:spermidine synthase